MAGCLNPNNMTPAGFGSVTDANYGGGIDGELSIDFVLNEQNLSIIADPDCPGEQVLRCLLYTSPSPRDATLSRMPSSA